MVKKKGKKLRNDLWITELPWYAINKSLPSDSYFTSKETAKKCFDIFLNVCNEYNIDVNEYTFIEPGAGDGSFFDLMPKDRRIGIDIIDRRADVIDSDFLKWMPDELDNKYITLGNPPFGIRGAIALAFINRSFLFSDAVGFILPMSFHSDGKGTNMRRVINGHLIHSVIIENEKFYSPDNDKEIKVNILFQVWKRGAGKGIFKEYDISEYAEIKTVNSDPKRYCGMDKLNEYDFFINSTFFENGEGNKIVYKFSDLKYSAGYGVIIKKNKDELLTKLSKINWIDYSSIATNSCRHIRMHHIRKCFFDMGSGKEINDINNSIFW